MLTTLLEVSEDGQATIAVPVLGVIAWWIAVESFEFCGAADDDSTLFMTRKQASTFLPVTSNHQLMIQRAIKSHQRRYQGGTTLVPGEL